MSSLPQAQKVLRTLAGQVSTQVWAGEEIVYSVVTKGYTQHFHIKLCFSFYTRSSFRTLFFFFQASTFPRHFIIFSCF